MPGLAGFRQFQAERCLMADGLPEWYPPAKLLNVVLLKLDIETKRPKFFNENVKGFRNARLEGVFSTNDRLIELCTA